MRYITIDNSCDTLNCIASEWSLITRQKSCFNFSRCFSFDSLCIFKWAKSFVMSLEKEMINQHAPRNGHATPIKNTFVQIAAMIWINAATKYPNGVCQSNGNLHESVIIFGNSKTTSVHKYLHHWRWQVKWFILVQTNHIKFDITYDDCWYCHSCDGYFDKCQMYKTKWSFDFFIQSMVAGSCNRITEI